MTAPRRYASLSGVSPKRRQLRDADHRGEMRVSSAKAMVALRFRGSTRLVPALNRSAGGLLVRLPMALRIGEQVSVLFPGGRRREAAVCWYHSEKAGIRFLD